MHAKTKIKMAFKLYLLTKYEVGAKTNPPKNPNSPPKKGMQIATKAVRAVMTCFI